MATWDEAVEVKFYEAFYDADLNADGDETDGIIIAYETVSVDLDGDGDAGDTSVTGTLLWGRPQRRRR